LLIREIGDVLGATGERCLMGDLARLSEHFGCEAEREGALDLVRATDHSGIKA
jgi:hypothetical protein